MEYAFGRRKDDSSRVVAAIVSVCDHMKVGGDLPLCVVG